MNFFELMKQIIRNLNATTPRIKKCLSPIANINLYASRIARCEPDLHDPHVRINVVGIYTAIIRPSRNTHIRPRCLFRPHRT